MNNFDKPYHSKSINEFWKRWHISLSSWFRDYLYISLGGNRVTIPRWYLNLFIVFLVSGLWHGASWTFVIWGALHGFYLIFALITEKFRERVNKVLFLNKIPFLQIFVTFILVTFSWIFFRARSLDTAFYVIKSMFTGLPEIFSKIRDHQPVIEKLGLPTNSVFFSFLLIAFLEGVHYLQSKRNISELLSRQPGYVRWAIYYTLILSIIFLGFFDSRQFIYFQF